MSVLSISMSALRPLVGLAILAIVLHLLSWLQPVLVPLALALLLAFVLNPVVTALQRHRLPRAAAVTVSVVLSFCVLSGVGWAVARQIDSLVDSYPQYEHNLRQRIAELREGEAGLITKTRRALKRIGEQLEEKQAADASEDMRATPPPDPVPVAVMPGSGTEVTKLWATYAPALKSLGIVGLALVLAIFLLMGREDLRDRVISLAGRGRLVVTTKALDEAGERISRYLLMQFALNSGYGVVVAAGLYLIGLPYALMWGLLAALLRYIPYLGPWIAALMPLGLSLLVAETWAMPLQIAALFLLVELVTNIVLEPWVYGRGAGVSETATLVMVAFWTWLWGPVGLVLATPLTVCLVLLGKYVPPLRFFDTLLGDQPALQPDVSYYQRLLARDQDEAAEIAAAFQREGPLHRSFDELLIPAVAHANRDRDSGGLDDADHTYVMTATREVAEELAQLSAADRGAEAAPAQPPAPGPLLGFPARDDADVTGLLMLSALMDPAHCTLAIEPTQLLASEIVERVATTRAAAVCIGSVAPGGLARIRLLCLRLHTRFPDLPIIVGRWGVTEDISATRDRLVAAGASSVVTTLEETRKEIAALLAIIARRSDVASSRPQPTAQPA